VPLPVLGFTIWISQPAGWHSAVGGLLLGVGLGMRGWAVAHIGPASRTRSDEVRRLVYTGPYELTRNPLYLANLVLYAGAGLMTARLGWALGLVAFMFVHYSLVVRWEEWNLEQKLGEVFRSYRNRVPRWLGSAAPVHAAAPREHADVRWPRALGSERSTVLAVALLAAAILVRGGLAGA